MTKTTAPIDKIKIFLSNRTNLILIAILALILVGGIFGVQRFLASRPQPALEEVDLPFDPDGPYALLEPRKDGNALILNIFRVSSYQAISYELTYQSKGSTADEGIGMVDRGVQGTLDTKNKKSEYSQEILFGTCSQGYTSGGSHCVFDKGVENGTLLLKIQKEKKLFKMLTTWHIQKPDIALGKITSADGHFIYKTDAKKDDLTNVGFTIVNDLSGAPKIPQDKKILGKVYAFNLPVAKDFPKGTVTIEVAENPPTDAKIARYVDNKNSWEMLDTKINGSMLTAPADGEGIFTVLGNNSNQK